ncbi:MAG: hypothetical protein UX42_C0006G0046 [Microgenomates group bacterium GW2011_GWC1_46_20]|nr:MAG: hypothetical protein UX42_C0006G0046 [Microgenomates group bacterium GW2011_GWC1_46_20]
MPAICWGALVKSATDPTTIDQEADSKILAHNQDPSAHSNTGEVLESHRSQSELDHPDNSVDADKLRVIVDDMDAAISYVGTWSYSVSSMQFYNRSYHTTLTPADYLTYMFTGTRIGIFSAKGPYMGKIDVYIDDVLDSTIDLYSALLLTRFLVYEKVGLSAGSHTIKIVLRSDKNAASTGFNFYFDAFKIGGYSAATFPVFSGHEFISIMGAYLNTPTLDQANLGMRFTETLASAQNSLDSAWQNLDLSSLIPAGAESVELYIENIKTTAARIAGARANGSSANRYFDISSPGNDGRNGYTMTVKLDSNRIIQILSEVAADIVFRVIGYWKQTRIPKITVNRDIVYLYDGEPSAAISLDVYALFMRS